MEIDITRIWQLNTTPILIIIGEPGMIKKNIDTYIKKIPFRDPKDCDMCMANKLRKNSQCQMLNNFLKKSFF